MGSSLNFSFSNIMSRLHRRMVCRSITENMIVKADLAQANTDYRRI
jgi:hypothetical protein